METPYVVSRQRPANRQTLRVAFCFILLVSQSAALGQEKASGAENVSPRPQYALEGCEDRVYHDRELGIRSSDPSAPCAFVGKSWVFNRAMTWLDAPGDTILCYSAGGDLPLTGERGKSEWFSDARNSVTQDGPAYTRFIQYSERPCDCIVLPGLQFHIEQHPVAHIHVSDATTEWQFCVLIKGRSGPPLVASAWSSGAGTLEIDLRKALQDRGHDLHYAELHFVVGLWNAKAEGDRSIRFALDLIASPCVIASLPVVRTRDNAQKNGTPITALVLDAAGKRLTRQEETLTAIVSDKTYPLTESNGIWSTVVPDLSVGAREVRLAASGAVTAETTATIRVTDGRFIGYDPATHSLTRAGRSIGPMTGSYLGMIYAKNVGQSDETLVQGQREFDAWDRIVPPGEHWHYWEALTEREMGARFRYLRESGWHLLHICQHWMIWEKLDAGGHIAPHGAEQMALYFRMAARHGLAVVQALSHYPYGNGYTPPYRQYYETGFQDDDWQRVDTPFTDRFHAYLADYTRLFRDETALAAMTPSGEGDRVAGPVRANDTAAFVTGRDPNHLFLSEPIYRMDKLPQEHCAGWNQSLWGSRLYWIGDDFEPEVDLGVEFGLMRTGPVFVAEGSWPCPHSHNSAVRAGGTWCGTLEYRTRVRDTLYIGLVRNVPILLTWQEQLTEDEHQVAAKITQAVDWAQSWQEPPVAIRVDTPNVRERREVLCRYETLFSSWPLATRCIVRDEPAPPGTVVEIDARQAFRAPAFASEGGTIPDEVKQQMPLNLSDGYRAAYRWSQDRRTLLAYVYNCTNHIERDYRHCLGGRFHRIPNTAPLQIRLQNLPQAPLRTRIYDLARKETVFDEAVTASHAQDLGQTNADFFVLVTPPES